MLLLLLESFWSHLSPHASTPRISFHQKYIFHAFFLDSYTAYENLSQQITDLIAKDIWYQTDSSDGCRDQCDGFRNRCNPNSIYRALSYFLLTILADPIAFW